MYVYSICLNSIKIDLVPFYCVSNNIFRSFIIGFVKQLTSLEERLIPPPLAFAQIYKLYNYGRYKLHGSIINVLASINLIQSILPRLLENKTTIGIVLKHHLEYKFP